MAWQTRFIAILFIGAVLLSACLPKPDETPVPGLEQTLAVRTLAAQNGLNYFATSTPLPIPTLPVFQQAPASVDSAPTQVAPVPSLTPISRNPGLVNDSNICQNKAEFVADVTFEDLSELKPGEEFTKIWKLRNVGDCTWSPDYSVVFASGDRMDAISPQPLGAAVPPGDSINVAVNLVAPKEPNFYQANFLLQDNQGYTFSCGSGSRDYFWVSVLVGQKEFKNLFGLCGGGG